MTNESIKNYEYFLLLSSRGMTTNTNESYHIKNPEKVERY